MTDVIHIIGRICLLFALGYCLGNLFIEIFGLILIYVGDRRLKASKRMPEKKVTSE